MFYCGLSHFEFSINILQLEMYKINKEILIFSYYRNQINIIKYVFNDSTFRNELRLKCHLLETYQ